MPAGIAHLVAGHWRDGHGEPIRSINPTRPDEIVAQGNSATPGDVDDAVAAAADALTGWAATPIHSRGAALAATAAIVDRNAEDWGRELAVEEGKTLAEGVGDGGLKLGRAEAGRLDFADQRQGDAATAVPGEVAAQRRLSEHLDPHLVGRGQAIVAKRGVAKGGQAKRKGQRETNGEDGARQGRLSRMHGEAVQTIFLDCDGPGAWSLAVLVIPGPSLARNPEPRATSSL
jgi:hypothetical protein